MSLVMPTLVSEHSDPEMYVFEPRNPTQIVSDAPGNIFNTVLYPMGQTTPIFHIGGGPSFVSLMDVSDPPNPLPVALIELSGTRWGGRRDASIIAEFIEWDMQLSSPSVELYQLERDATNPGDVSDRETLIHYFNLVDARAAEQEFSDLPPQDCIVEETRSRRHNELTLKFKDGHDVDGEVLVVLRWDRDVRRWILEALEHTVCEGLWEVAITLFLMVLGRVNPGCVVDRHRRAFVNPDFVPFLHASALAESARSTAPAS